MKHVAPNQPPLDGMPIPRDVDFERPRVSLYRALSPEFWGKEPSDYSDITDEMRLASNPRRLLHDLIYAPINSNSAVSYLPHGSKQSVNVALTPTEYKLIIRNADSFSRSVRNTTLAARPIGESHNVAADRSVIHAHIGKIAAIETYITETLAPWSDLLDKFIKNADNPRFSHFGHEDTFRIQFEVLMTGILGNMLDALSVQRNWTAQQRAHAQRTIEARILIDGDKKGDRVERFKLLTTSMRRYQAHKRALFTDRLDMSKEITATVDDF